ncbi:uncharacterized protein V1510DRAFT_421588 [Dipodascopsis tothii]|uniref:uncharacterized protein n=1 Tax=Dipodascopsis tothii TaxID=44089 RepID=UPI0034CF2F09
MLLASYKRRLGALALRTRRPACAASAAQRNTLPRLDSTCTYMSSTGTNNSIQSRRVFARQLHSSAPASAVFDFLKSVKLRQSKTEEQKKAEEEEEEEEEDEASEAAAAVPGITLADVKHRKSAITVEGEEGSELLEEVLEIGFKSSGRGWRDQMKGFTVESWKSQTPVESMDAVERAAKLVVAAETGAVTVDWAAPFAVYVDGARVESPQDPFTTLLEATTVPELDADWQDFRLDDVAARFAVTKRLSQLTGRTVPDAVFSKSRTVGDLVQYYATALKKSAKYGFHQEDPYNPYKTRLLIDPKEYAGTNVTIVERPSKATLAAVKEEVQREIEKRVQQAEATA